MEATEARDAALLAEHLNESLRKLPGPAYYNVLNWIHQALQPANYLEIGVQRGTSLEQAERETPCIGIDPSPNIEHELSPAVTIYALTSDQFFERYDPSDLFGGPVELAFIDGLHLFEQVLVDFINVERHSSASTVVLLHDCLPLDEATASRERTTDFYSGDVWKAAFALHRVRPDLEMTIVPTAPTGLCLVRGLRSDDTTLTEAFDEIEATYRDFGFDYYLAHRDEMPQQIANDEDSVRAWLASGAG
jgi:hypothetical protein